MNDWLSLNLRILKSLNFVMKNKIYLIYKIKNKMNKIRFVINYRYFFDF
jgi:hypothetical protein